MDEESGARAEAKDAAATKQASATRRGSFPEPKPAPSATKPEIALSGRDVDADGDGKISSAELADKLDHIQDHGQYEEVLRTWNVDPETVQGAVTKGVVKAADQSLPLTLARYRAGRGKRAVKLIVLVMMGAFALGFFWNANMLWNCSEDNGCKVCSLSIEDESRRGRWQDTSRPTTCNRVATPTLEIDAGCMSFSVDNDYAMVDRVFRYAQGGRWEPLLRAHFAKQPEAAEAVDAFVKSFYSNVELWTECFSENKHDQVGDPDVQCVIDWAKDNWAGYSELFRLFGGRDPQNVSWQSWIAYAIRLAYSAYTTSCALYTTLEMDSPVVTHDVTYHFGPLAQSLGDGPGPQPVEYLNLHFSGAKLVCPDALDAEDPSAEATAGVVAKEADVNFWEGLGEARLAIPARYIVTSYEEYEQHGRAALLTGELVRDWVGAGGRVPAGQDPHCPSATVNAGTVATHLDTVYECCHRKSYADVLASMYAFGGVVMQGAVLALAMIFVPFETTYLSHGKTKDEMAADGAVADAPTRPKSQRQGSSWLFQWGTTE